MCGRFTLFCELALLAERFAAALPLGGFPPRYNAAPSQRLPVILNQEEREFRLLRWGLIPPWAENSQIGYKMINARSETVAEKRSYRGPFARRRCLVPADGFYEWKSDGERGKQPMRFLLKSKEPFAMAGLWETWNSPDGETVRTFCLITTDANEVVAPTHHRMPVILRPEHEERWLDNSLGQEERLQLLVPYPPDLMSAYPVSKRVNATRHDDPGLVEAIVPTKLVQGNFFAE